MYIVPKKGYLNFKLFYFSLCCFTLVFRNEKPKSYFLVLFKLLLLLPYNGILQVQYGAKNVKYTQKPEKYLTILDDQACRMHIGISWIYKLQGLYKFLVEGPYLFSPSSTRDRELRRSVSSCLWFNVALCLSHPLQHPKSLWPHLTLTCSLVTSPHRSSTPTSTPDPVLFALSYGPRYQKQPSQRVFLLCLLSSCSNTKADTWCKNVKFPLRRHCSGCSPRFAAVFSENEGQ